ncbi:Uncharacterized protein HZ326_24584 [Fusarium oxysporum f. sp. albedinis]|nr:Uncharacterized protein HZ326_24584 [Fusarium oxysporum f. sp. albedinis]
MRWRHLGVSYDVFISPSDVLTAACFRPRLSSHPTLLFYQSAIFQIPSREPLHMLTRQQPVICFQDLGIHPCVGLSDQNRTTDFDGYGSVSVRQTQAGSL